MRKFLLAFLLLAVNGHGGASLLSNGNFASDSKTVGWPDDWPHADNCTWENENGVRFLRLKSSQPGQMVAVYRQIALPTPAPAALEIRLQVRYAGLTRGEKPWFDGRVIMHFKNAAGNIVKPEPAPPAWHGSSSGWVETTLVVPIPVHARTFEFMPCLFQAAAGTLDLARCEIFAATAAQLPKRLTVHSSPIVPAQQDGFPAELRVAGNQLETADGKSIWLQGLCVDSLEWSAAGEHVAESIPVAIEQWHANVIRLPVAEKFWTGHGPGQKKDGGVAYRQLVDAAVEAAASRGAYLVLDLHRFGAPMSEDVEFWQDAATRYNNHPAVVFELFNEPHGLSWKTWRDGGELTAPANKHSDVNAAENAAQPTGEVTPGLQALVDAVRSTGAHNVIIAGGLDWSYDLLGVVNGFALADRAGGHGIVYSAHIYPWKKSWARNVLAAAAKFPVFVGEVGAPGDWKGFEFIPREQRIDLSKPDWVLDVLGLIQQHKLHWTGFSFHPHCGPMVIADWQYTPTPYWGAFVKEALAGRAFDSRHLR